MWKPVIFSRNAHVTRQVPMTRPVVSLIVPVYNTERFLPECVESILSQSFPSFEILLVDDDSPDQASQVIKSLCLRDPRIIGIKNRSNEGAFIARQVGFRAATGNYIATIDSDDWISPFFLEELVAGIEKVKADIVGCLAMQVRPGTAPITFDHTSCPKTIYEGDLVESLIVAGHPRFNVWNKIYKRSVWDQAVALGSHCRAQVANDFLWTLHLYEFARKYVHLDRHLYYYRRHDGSVWGRAHPSRALEMIRRLCDTLNSAVAFLERMGRGELISKLGECSICTNALTKLILLHGSQQNRSCDDVISEILVNCPYLGSFVRQWSKA